MLPYVKIIIQNTPIKRWRKIFKKKVRNTIFLYFLKHILYIHLPEQPHLYGSDFQNYSTLILYFAPDVHS
ncbi:MAG TPA: hypothetical protein DER54_08460 [Odoribacter splanchnicus]|nr:hypothetical protein [Odoribacter splanchnicus]